MENLLENILAMLKIKSVSGNEAAIAEILDFVQSHYGRPPVIARRFTFAGASPSLLLANCEGDDFDILAVGHLDVVPAADEQFVPQIKDGRIYARGSSDMKAQAAVMLQSLQYSLDKSIRFAVLLTTDEETDSRGIKALMQNHPLTAQAVLDTDAGSLSTICDKAKHPVSVRISAAGESAHSSRPWNGINAANKLMACIRELQVYFPQYDKDGKQPSDIWADTMVLTAFNTPTAYNVVPDEAEALLNFRLTEKTSYSQLLKLLSEVTAKHGCNYEVKLRSCGVYMDIHHPLLRQYMQCAAAVIGRPLQVAQLCGGTDARMFADKSVVIMHSADGGNAHGKDEYVDIASLRQLAEIERKFIDWWIAREN